MVLLDGFCERENPMKVWMSKWGTTISGNLYRDFFEVCHGDLCFRKAPTYLCLSHSHIDDGGPFILAVLSTFSGGLLRIVGIRYPTNSPGLKPRWHRQAKNTMQIRLREQEVGNFLRDDAGISGDLC